MDNSVKKSYRKRKDFRSKSRGGIADGADVREHVEPDIPIKGDPRPNAGYVKARPITPVSRWD